MTTTVRSGSEATDAGLVFFSRIDAWLVLSVGAAVGLCFYLAWHLQRPPALAIAGLTVAAVVALTVPCKYTLKANHLAIRCGVLHWRLPYADIAGVAPSRSILSAPALSLKRVAVSCRRTVHLVSPRDRERFMKEIRARLTTANGLTNTPA